MSKNDDRILELRKQIETRQNLLELSKVKFVPKTNLVIELDGEKHNLNVANENKLNLLLVKLNMYAMSANDLKLYDFKISGYPIVSWMSDINGKLNILSIKKQEKELADAQAKLECLLSEDKKTELEIDAIAAMFG